MSDSANHDLTALHNAMVEQIRAAMPVLQTVEAYNPLQGKAINTPAVLLEVVEMTPGRAVSGGRLPMTLEISAHCCLSVQTDAVELEVRNFAAKLLQVVQNNRWNLAGFAEKPERLSAYPGMFKPDDKGFESWVVSWEQTVHLGDAWEDPDFLPTEVYVGEAPNIGADHVDDYERVV